MANASRGRWLLLVVLGAYLAGVSWLWVRYPFEDAGQRAIQIGLWGALPVVLAGCAAFGAAWARRGLAVVWALHGALLFYFAQDVTSHLARGGAISFGEALTPAVVSVVCLLAAVVVIVQKDIREMTRPW